MSERDNKTIVFRPRRHDGPDADPGADEPVYEVDDVAVESDGTVRARPVEGGLAKRRSLGSRGYRGPDPAPGAGRPTRLASPASAEETGDLSAVRGRAGAKKRRAGRSAASHGRAGSRRRTAASAEAGPKTGSVAAGLKARVAAAREARKAKATAKKQAGAYPRRRSDDPTPDAGAAGRAGRAHEAVDAPAEGHGAAPEDSSSVRAGDHGRGRGGSSRGRTRARAARAGAPGDKGTSRKSRGAVAGAAGAVSGAVGRIAAPVAARLGAKKEGREKPPSLREDPAAFAQRHRKGIVALVAVVLLVVFLYEPAALLYRAHRENGILQEQLEIQNQENAVYEQRAKDLMTEQGIEDEARVHGYVKAGEETATVTGLPDQADAGEAAALPESVRDQVLAQEDPWYVRAADWLFGYEKGAR